VVDVRTLAPLDTETIVASVKKTSRALVLDAGHARYGITGELAAVIGEHAFDYLDAPVARLAAPDVPIPFGRSLEPLALPRVGEIEARILELIG
jgi:pyruvate/2-oxoglutarate/acetoin dehydrogenase E1 component